MVVTQGLREVNKMLHGLPQAMNHRIVQAAIAESAKPLVAAAKSIAPLGKTGNLKSSIGIVKPSIRKVKEIGTVNVGPRRGGGHKGFHGHLVEKGAGPRPPGGWYAKFKNAHTTFMKATPFMRPALAQTKGVVLDAIGKNIGIKLRNYMRRTLKKQGTWIP